MSSAGAVATTTISKSVIPTVAPAVSSAGAGAAAAIGKATLPMRTSWTMEIPDAHRSRFEQATAGIETVHRVTLFWLGSNRQTKLSVLRVSATSETSLRDAKEELSKVGIGILNVVISRVCSTACINQSRLFLLPFFFSIQMLLFEMCALTVDVPAGRLPAPSSDLFVFVENSSMYVSRTLPVPLFLSAASFMFFLGIADTMAPKRLRMKVFSMRNWCVAWRLDELVVVGLWVA